MSQSRSSDYVEWREKCAAKTTILEFMHTSTCPFEARRTVVYFKTDILIIRCVCLMKFLICLQKSELVQEFETIVKLKKIAFLTKKCSIVSPLLV